MSDASGASISGSELSFLANAGQVGALIRAHDWSQSSLGNPSTWPQSLRSVVGLLLNSEFAMFVAWGDELSLLYNDRFIEILGAKHPHALGQSFRDVWAEVWSELSPLIEAALRGESSYNEDLPLIINRNGFDEQGWFTLSYSPVRDEAGHATGMFCVCTETTQKVIAARRQQFLAEISQAMLLADDPRRTMQAAVELLGLHLGANQIG